jgi:hypothetical protein
MRFACGSTSLTVYSYEAAPGGSDAVEKAALDKAQAEFNASVVHATHGQVNKRDPKGDAQEERRQRYEVCMLEGMKEVVNQMRVMNAASRGGTRAQPFDYSLDYDEQ